MHEARINPSPMPSSQTTKPTLSAAPRNYSQSYTFEPSRVLLSKLLCHDPNLASSIYLSINGHIARQYSRLAYPLLCTTTILKIHGHTTQHLLSMVCSHIMYYHIIGIQVYPSSKYLRLTGPCIKLSSPQHDPLGHP